jgi:predicted unusual protein kinase regulating ubiquinone biosynthesis (AarF/ABC1/UbiB family)
VYLESLSELQDRLPSFPNEIAWAVMEEELGRPVAEVYDQLSEQPVAAASLGQVYKGILRETGELVAVKVQRPAIGESIAVDMLLLRRLMAAVDKNLPQVSQPLVPLVDEFAARLFAELDYVAEGHNAERFQVGSLTGSTRVFGTLASNRAWPLSQFAQWPGRPNILAWCH